MHYTNNWFNTLDDEYTPSPGPSKNVKKIRKLPKSSDNAYTPSVSEESDKVEVLKDGPIIPKIATIALDKELAKFPTFQHHKRDSVSDLFGKNDYSFVSLKKDHGNRPLWINPVTGNIILEGFSPFAEKAQDFLITISEPVSRPSLIHEYKMTPYSLYAAVSVGLETEAIIDVLKILSKTEIPESLIEMIRKCTVSYGKVKLLLKHNKYFVESSHAEILQMLLQDKDIADARLINADGTNGNEFITSKAPSGKDLVISGKVAEVPKSSEAKNNEAANRDDELFNAVVAIDKGNEGLLFLHAWITVRRRCNELNYPMLEEYDFRNDASLAPLDIDLKPITVIRPYQEKCLSKMFGNGVSVMQWKQQFVQWSNIKESQIAVFTSDQKEKFSGQSGIVISTYSMVANTRARSYEASKMMQFITEREWGFILLDEVHVVPANMFRKVVTTIAAHTKLGLTATLVREDDKIEDLNFLIGPKLYEANWMDLASKGHIANVQCAEACQYLIRYHENRGDKVIVFSDNVYALERYAKDFNVPFIHGKTKPQERLHVLSMFQHSPDTNTIFLSKVGDTSIDLPEATCLIQISSHYGSRRQEAQRLGRILRAKRRNDEGFNAFFYSLVSTDTQEMYYSTKRQQFLIDQGYAFKVITSLEGMDKEPNLVYREHNKQMALLTDVLVANDNAAELDNDIDENADDLPGTVTSRNKGVVRRSFGNMKSLSGADDMAYYEGSGGSKMELSNDVNVTRENSPEPADSPRNKSKARNLKASRNNGLRGLNKRTKKNKGIKSTNKTNKGRNKNKSKDLAREIKESEPVVQYQPEPPPREELPYTKFFPDLDLDEQLVIFHVLSENDADDKTPKSSTSQKTVQQSEQQTEDTQVAINECSTSGTTPQFMDEDTVQEDDQASDVELVASGQIEVVYDDNLIIPTKVEVDQDDGHLIAESSASSVQPASTSGPTKTEENLVAKTLVKKLPMPSFRRVSVRKMEFEPYHRPEGHYIRYNEPDERILAERVEYDMDEQDDIWLKAFNNERKKEDLGELTADLFEKLIDRLEKAWFDLTKNLPKGQGDKDSLTPEDSACAICDDGECENSNAIVFCDGCNLAVHQDCYGIPYIPEGQWLCRKCIVSPETPVSCIFCPNEGGAFKKTNTNRWAHLLCALWIPEVGLSNTVYMEPIDNIEGIPRGRWKLAKLCMRMKFPDSHNESYQMKAYCDKHTPRDYKEQVDVTATVLAAQKLLSDCGPASKKRRVEYEADGDEYIPSDSEEEEDELEEQNYEEEKFDTSDLRKNRKRKHSENESYQKKTVKVKLQESENVTEIANKSQEGQSSKAARAYNHSYAENAPIAPAIIMEKLLPLLANQKGSMKKKQELVATICKYWSLKRESRRGAPLLKRLHLEPWTASASAHKQSDKEKFCKFMGMRQLRKDLEKVRLLIDCVHRREKAKLKRNRLQARYLETILFPLDYILSPVIRTIMSLDKNEIFAKPVSAEEVPDYYYHIKNPMDFGTIQKKIEAHEYSFGPGLQGFKDDLELTFLNAMTYNTSNTIYYRTARKLRQLCQPIIEKAEKDYSELHVDPKKGILDVQIHPEIFTYNTKPLVFMQKEKSRSSRIKLRSRNASSRVRRLRETRSTTVAKRTRNQSNNSKSRDSPERKPRAPKGWAYVTDEEGEDESVDEGSNSEGPTSIDTGGLGEGGVPSVFNEDKATVSSRTRSRNRNAGPSIKVVKEQPDYPRKTAKDSGERPNKSAKKSNKKSKVIKEPTENLDTIDEYDIDLTNEQPQSQASPDENNKTIKEQFGNISMKDYQDETEKPAASRTRSRAPKKGDEAIQNEAIKKENLSPSTESNAEWVQSSRKGSTTSSVIENPDIRYGTLVWAKMTGFPWYPAEVADPNGPEVTETIRCDKKK
ncbi:16621_t:CDS:10, partial [Acaulospora colombiana]